MCAFVRAAAPGELAPPEHVRAALSVPTGEAVDVATPLKHALLTLKLESMSLLTLACFTNQCSRVMNALLGRPDVFIPQGCAALAVAAMWCCDSVVLNLAANDRVPLLGGFTDPADMWNNAYRVPVVAGAVVGCEDTVKGILRECLDRRSKTDLAARARQTELIAASAVIALMAAALNDEVDVVTCLLEIMREHGFKSLIGTDESQWFVDRLRRQSDPARHGSDPSLLAAFVEAGELHERFLLFAMDEEGVEAEPEDSDDEDDDVVGLDVLLTKHCMPCWQRFTAEDVAEEEEGDDNDNDTRQQKRVKCE